MKLSDKDCFILSTAIEHLYLSKDICSLNKKGIEKLANIYARMGKQLFEINVKDVEKRVSEKMLKEINYTKD